MTRAPIRREAGYAGSTGTISVEPDALAAAAAALDQVARRLDGVTAAARGRAMSAYDAVPPSDLQGAYGYCWGRWSQALIDVRHELAAVQTLTGRAGAVYADLDRPPG